jgi:membrane fusion protein (multidrug efflux system)
MNTASRWLMSTNTFAGGLFTGGPVFLIAAAVILLLAIIFGARYWAYARSHESTDDAFVDGHIIQVSPKVPGYVLKVYVSDNQIVNAGDLIAEIDARDLPGKSRSSQSCVNGRSVAAKASADTSHAHARYGPR